MDIKIIGVWDVMPSSFFWGGGGSHLPQRTKAAHATKMLLLLPQYTPSHPSRLLSYYSDLSTARWTDHTSCELHWPFTRRLCNIIQSLCSVLFCSRVGNSPKTAISTRPLHTPIYMTRLQASFSYFLASML
jgi:hypothetical protein